MISMDIVFEMMNAPREIKKKTIYWLNFFIPFFVADIKNKKKEPC